MSLGPSRLFGPASLPRLHLLPSCLPPDLAHPAGTPGPRRLLCLALKVGQGHDAPRTAERDGPQALEGRFRYDDPYKDTSYIAVRRIRSALPFPFVTPKPAPHVAGWSVAGISGVTPTPSTRTPQGGMPGDIAACERALCPAHASTVLSRPAVNPLCPIGAINAGRSRLIRIAPDLALVFAFPRHGNCFYEMIEPSQYPLSPYWYGLTSRRMTQAKHVAPVWLFLGGRTT